MSVCIFLCRYTLYLLVQQEHISWPFYVFCFAFPLVSAIAYRYALGAYSKVGVGVSASVTASGVSCS